MKQPITVVIACKEGSQRLATCIDRSLSFADEVLIAELDPQIDTKSLAIDDERVRVVPHEPIRKDDFLNWSISKATHQWVLLLDSDERPSRQLADEIELVLSRGATYDAYTINRETFVNGTRLEAATATSSRRVRLFRKDLAFCIQNQSAKTIDIQSGRIGKLSNKIRRDPDWRFERALETVTFEAAEDADQWNKQGRKASATRLLLAPMVHFAVQYFWRGSIFDGAAGVRCSWQTAFQRFCTHANLYELQQKSESLDEIETIDPATIDLLDPTFRRAA